MIDRWRAAKRSEEQCTYVIGKRFGQRRILLNAYLGADCLT